MKLINDLKALGVTLSDEEIAGKVKELGFEGVALSDAEVKDLAASMNAGNKLAIASKVESVTPTKSTKGRGKSKTAIAKGKADQVNQDLGFHTAISQAQQSAANVEDFSVKLEEATVAYCQDRLESVPYNIQAEVMRRAAAVEPVDFQPFTDAMYNSPAARGFFALVAPIESDEGE